MFRYLAFAALLAAIGFACHDLGQRGAQAYERMLVRRVSDGLGALGYGWANVHADGLELVISGHAPDTATRKLALEASRAMAPLAQIVSFATATLAPPEHRDPVHVEILRDEDGITLTGQTASRKMRKRLIEMLGEGEPDLPIENLAGIQAAAPQDGMAAEIVIADLAISRLPNAYVVIEPGKVTISGQAPDEAERAALAQELLRQAGESVRLSLEIRVPLRMIAPFGFAADKTAHGGMALERCAARSAEEQVALRAILISAGIGFKASPCPVGLGGPEGDWVAAVGAAAQALAALPAGHVEIRYRNARLEGAPPTTSAAFKPVLANFLAALPRKFTGSGQLLTGDPDARQAIEREQFWMRLQRTAEGITLAGEVSTDIVQTSIISKARALFGSAGVEGKLTVTGTPSPAGWQDAALALLDYLHELASGEASLAGDRATLEGVIEKPATARRLHDRMAADLLQFDISTTFRVDLPAVLAGMALPPPACVARLERLNGRHAIDFKPGSVAMTRDSARVLDEMAAILSRCAGVPIVVGGHTDSQGSEELNRRLSQARADTVYQALVDRGVPPDHILARGFGEARPITTNETAAGRARNRRIEFEPAG